MFHQLEQDLTTLKIPVIFQIQPYFSNVVFIINITSTTGFFCISMFVQIHAVHSNKELRQYICVHRSKNKYAGVLVVQ